jgi:hypothetical protein
MLGALALVIVLVAAFGIMWRFTPDPDAGYPHMTWKSIKEAWKKYEEENKSS